MLKEATYKEKYLLLKDWIPHVIDAVKKEIKNEHLRDDWLFVKTYLGNKSLSKVSVEDLIAGYNQAIAQEEKAEEIAEFIFNRWLLKHTDLYQFFEEELSRINPNFTELTEIEPGSAFEMMEDAIKRFGATNTYLFAVINSVVFPNTVMDQLKNRAQEEAYKHHTRQQEEAEQLSRQAMIQQHEQQILRLTDKYEKKLSGLQKKYIVDTTSLKKQLALLQRKLHEVK